MIINQSREASIIFIVFGYILKFIGYNFLTPVVLIGFVGLAVIYILVIGPDVPFLKYLDFILPTDASGTGQITGKDIMRVYSILSMGLFGVSVLWDWLKRWIKRSRAGSEPANAEVNIEGEGLPVPRRRLPNILKRILTNSVLITLIYIGVFIVLPGAHMAEGNSLGILYGVMVFFYFTALVSHAIFTGIDTAANKLINLGLSNLINQ